MVWDNSDTHWIRHSVRNACLTLLFAYLGGKWHCLDSGIWLLFVARGYPCSQRLPNVAC